MTRPHKPLSECPRLGGAGPTHKALRTVHGTAVPGMRVNGTCPCDPSGQKGKTAVREVEARLYAAKMNQEIDGWNYFAYKEIFNCSQKCNEAMATLLYGYNKSVFHTAVVNFLKGARGTFYYNKGYYEGSIPEEPLIKKFLIE